MTLTFKKIFIITSSLFLLMTLINCSPFIKTKYQVHNDNTIHVDTGCMKECNPRIIFLHKFNNHVKVFINDSLYFNKRLTNINEIGGISPIAEGVSIDKFVQKIEIKVGLCKKKVLIWNGSYKYIYISRKPFFGNLKCEMTNNKRWFK